MTDVESAPEKTSKRGHPAKKSGQETDVENAPTEAVKRARTKKEGGQMSAATKASAKKRDQQKKTDGVVKEKKHDLMIIDLPDKLAAARFRYINEKLYTCTGEEAERFFAEG